MRPTLTFLIPLALLALATYLFHTTSWDLDASGAYYDGNPDTVAFPQIHQEPWDTLYDLGRVPAIVISVAGALAFIASFWVPALVRWRRHGLFLILLLAIGPGLVINAVFKEHWGRPRPRDIQPFGGEYAFEKVLTIDPSSPGKSFPSGHASMGFYFAGFFFLFRKWPWRIAALLFGLAFGSLMGLARIAQGGHFASDILWSGGFTFLVSAALYYLLGMHKEIDCGSGD